MKDARGKEIFMQARGERRHHHRKLPARRDQKTRHRLRHRQASSIPGVIYASMSGFGQTGPYGKKGGFDIIAQGMSRHHDDDRLSRRPPRQGRHRDERHRERRDRALRHPRRLHRQAAHWQGPVSGNLAARGGPRVDASGNSAPTSAQASCRPATGTRHRRSTPYQAYKTRDGYVTVGANNDKLWTNFCTHGAATNPNGSTDPRFNDAAVAAEEHRRAGKGNRDGVRDRSRPRTGWRSSTRPRFPAGPVYTYDQILADPHIKARNMVVEMDHPKIGRMKTLGLPVKSTGELTSIRTPAPWLGQHSEEVLRGLGLSGADDRRAVRGRRGLRQVSRKGHDLGLRLNKYSIKTARYTLSLRCR